MSEDELNRLNLLHFIHACDALQRRAQTAEEQRSPNTDGNNASPAPAERPVSDDTSAL